MKPFFAITLSVVLFISAAITLAGSEEICGTWINTEYYKGIHHSKWQKRIFSPDGTTRFYREVSLTSPDFDGTYTITEKWTDSDKNIWYKVKTTGKMYGDQYVAHYLFRISNSGKTLESVYHPVDYHKELDPKHPTYRILYRK